MMTNVINRTAAGATIQAPTVVCERAGREARRPFRVTAPGVNGGLMVTD
jgi:hypothetical protein